MTTSPDLPPGTEALRLSPPEHGRRARWRCLDCGIGRATLTLEDAREDAWHHAVAYPCAEQERRLEARREALRARGVGM